MRSAQATCASPWKCIERPHSVSTSTRSAKRHLPSRGQQMSRQAEGNACLSAPVRTGASGGLSGRRPGGGSGSHKPSPPGRGRNVLRNVLLAQQPPGSCARVGSSGVGIDLRLPKATTSGDPAGAAAANSPRGTLGKDTRTWGGGRRVEETRQCPRLIYLVGPAPPRSS